MTRGSGAPPLYRRHTRVGFPNTRPRDAPRIRRGRARPSACKRKCSVARRAIRQRLSIIILLGVLTAALSLVALIRALSAMSRTLRLERAREGVVEEVDRLARMEPSADALALPRATSHVGLRGGWVRAPEEAERVAGVPVKWRAPLRRTLDAAARTGETAVTETDFGSASLVMGAKQATSGGLAWTAYLVPPATYLGPLRTAITALAAATGPLLAPAGRG